MVYEARVIEHRSSRPGRWLHDRRARFALWIAVAEAVLLVVHVISWWAAILVAALFVGLWFWGAHRLRSQTAREVFWIAAVSQALVALVPILVIVIGTLALIAVALLAVVALIALFASRP